MKSNTIRKINNFGKAGYVICKIGRIAVMIAAIACLVGAVLMCFVPEDAVTIELSTANSAVIHVDESIELSGIPDLVDSVLSVGTNTYRVVGKDGGDAMTEIAVFRLSDLKWILFVGVVACAASYLSLYYGCRLCGYFKSCETPFTEEIAKGLMKLAWSLIPMCVLNALLQGFANSVLRGEFAIGFELDMISVLLVLCVFMLSFIFKHGTALQVEADETL